LARDTGNLKSNNTPGALGETKDQKKGEKHAKRGNEQRASPKREEGKRRMSTDELRESEKRLQFCKSRRK